MKIINNKDQDGAEFVANSQGVSKAKIDRRLRACQAYMWAKEFQGLFSYRITRHNADNFYWQICSNDGSGKFAEFLTTDSGENMAINDVNTSCIRDTINDNAAESLLPLLYQDIKTK